MPTNASIPTSDYAENDASIIEQLQAQNAALMEQNNALNAQVVQMIQNGAQMTDAPQQPQQPQPQPMPQGMNALNPVSLTKMQDDEYTLEGLAKDIGKHDQNPNK